MAVYEVGVASFARHIRYLGGEIWWLKMERAASPSRLPPEFDDFLFASIGEEPSGMLLSVVSALAETRCRPVAGGCQVGPLARRGSDPETRLVDCRPSRGAEAAMGPNDNRQAPDRALASSTQLSRPDAKVLARHRRRPKIPGPSLRDSCRVRAECPIVRGEPPTAGASRRRESSFVQLPFAQHANGAGPTVKIDRTRLKEMSCPTKRRSRI